MKSDVIEEPKSDEESPFIQHSVHLIDFLSKVLDKEYELILFSFKRNRKDGEIVVIRNGYISGRKLGDGMLPEGKQALSSRAFRYSNSVINYAVCAANGNRLACSALVLGNNPEQPDGILCINKVIAADYMFAPSLDSMEELKQLYEPFLVGTRNSDVAVAASGILPVGKEAAPLNNASLRNKLVSALIQVTGTASKDPKELSVEERISV